MKNYITSIVLAALLFTSCGKNEDDSNSVTGRTTPLTDARLIGTWYLKMVEGDYQGVKFQTYYTCREVIGNNNDITEFYTDTIMNVVTEATGKLTTNGNNLKIESLTGYIILPEDGQMSFSGDSCIITASNAGIDYTYFLVR